MTRQKAMAENKKIPLATLNEFDQQKFVQIIGPVFEHSPWIAEMAWNKKPFTDFENLHHALCETVKSSSGEKQLALIRAHPDLVGRLALAGQLTRESTKEQSSAGLDKLSPDEVNLFQTQNAAYKEIFGFPFIICARLNKKEAILKGFESRLKNSRKQEISTALAEIFKIAELRLRDLLST
jgi:2-oxo-4-hydroxy-4-carboxy-5-ureidoimidazoline decarboxylase